MTTNKISRINDMSQEHLQADMKKYGETKSRTVRTARRYLRSLGMDIKTDGSVNVKISKG